MGYLRNLLCFGIFALIVAGCGGGNTTLANDNSSSTSTGTTASSGPVNNTKTVSVTLKWTAPTTLADGTPVSLSDISGYKLYYGSSQTNTPNVISINNGTATQYTVNLPAGTYYFTICAVDSSGQTGLQSVAIQKTI